MFKWIVLNRFYLTALTAMEKLMGLILVSLSVEMMIKGIKSIH